MKRADSRVILSGFAAILACFAIARMLGLEEGTMEWVGLSSVGLVAVLVLYVYRSLLASQSHGIYKQQSLHTLYQWFTFRAALPPMTEWAASPELGATVASLILETRSRVVLECGSGISTILTSYALEKNGAGTLISLESDGAYRLVTQNNLIRHGQTARVSLHDAPLETFQLAGSSWRWYDIRSIALQPKSIDLLVVDGPFTKLQTMARYPAVPLLREALSDTCIIVLDDAARKSERDTVAAWLKELPGYDHTYIRCERGISILRPKPEIR